MPGEPERVLVPMSTRLTERNRAEAELKTPEGLRPRIKRHRSYRPSLQDAVRLPLQKHHCVLTVKLHQRSIATLSVSSCAKFRGSTRIDRPNHAISLLKPGDTLHLAVTDVRNRTNGELPVVASIDSNLN
jgi:hypothetical protein